MDDTFVNRLCSDSARSSPWASAIDRDRKALPLSDLFREIRRNRGATGNSLLSSLKPIKTILFICRRYWQKQSSTWTRDKLAFFILSLLTENENRAETEYKSFYMVLWNRVHRQSLMKLFLSNNNSFSLATLKQQRPMVLPPFCRMWTQWWRSMVYLVIHLMCIFLNLMVALVQIDAP